MPSALLSLLAAFHQVSLPERIVAYGTALRYITSIDAQFLFLLRRVALGGDIIWLDILLCDFVDFFQVEKHPQVRWQGLRF